MNQRTSLSTLLATGLICALTALSGCTAQKSSDAAGGAGGEGGASTSGGGSTAAGGGAAGGSTAQGGASAQGGNGAGDAPGNGGAGDAPGGGGAGDAPGGGGAGDAPGGGGESQAGGSGGAVAAGGQQGCEAKRITVGKHTLSFDPHLVEIDVTDDIRSFTLTASMDNHAVSAGPYKVERPDGSLAYDPDNLPGQYLTNWPTAGLPYTAMYPNGSSLTLTAGKWKFWVTAAEEGPGTIEVFLKPKCAGKAVLPLSIWFTKVHAPKAAPLTAASAMSEPGFVDMMKGLREMFAGVSGEGIEVPEARVELHDVAELLGDAKAESYGTIDTEAELYELLSEMNMADVKGVPIIFTDNFTMWPTTGGYSANLPGPPSLPGVRRSGLVVALTPEYYDTPGVPYGLGTTIAHEIGHYLGLFHTSSRTGDTVDPIDDTPVCTATDAAGEHTVDACGEAANNVMFWAGSATPTGFTKGQLDILKNHPMVELSP